MKRETRQVRVGCVPVGGGAPVSVQSMANADPHDAAALLKQIESCAALGCDIFRLTVPDVAAAETLGVVRKASPIPLVADIHFDYRCALAAIANGTDALRLNPGNIGARDRVQAVARAAKEKGIPIRIGVNLGSLEKDLRERLSGFQISDFKLQRQGSQISDFKLQRRDSLISDFELQRQGSQISDFELQRRDSEIADRRSRVPELLCESALRHLKMLEDEGFRDVVISAKASNVADTLATYRLLAERTDCPLHLGVTEAGTFLPGTVRNSVALGILLSEGIGDTIRVSLTDQPEKEVRVGMEILRSLGLKAPGPSITSCPTCGRTKVNLLKVAAEVEERLEKLYLETYLEKSHLETYTDSKLQISDCKQEQISDCKQGQISDCKQGQISNCRTEQISDCRQGQISDCKQGQISDCKQGQISDCKQGQSAICNLPSAIQTIKQSPNQTIPFPHVAVMGCVVNGPGEAKGADIALCGGDGEFVLYRNGQPLRKVAESAAADEVLACVRRTLEDTRRAAETQRELLCASASPRETTQPLCDSASPRETTHFPDHSASLCET